MIRLLDARRGLYRKCEELFGNAKIAEAIYRFLCDGIEECEDYPTADVVDKERYDRLLENGLIISEALNKYQTADFVEVVRCKDCKYWDEEFGECDHPKVGRRFEVPAGFYCGWGERREE